jgi:uncharacterized protein (DUF2267 family)
MLKSKSNRIRGAGDIECRVIEWIDRGMTYQDISDKLSNEYRFTACPKTVCRYKIQFLDDINAEVVQALRKRVAKSVQLDTGRKNRHIQDFSGYIESLYLDIEYHTDCIHKLKSRLMEIEDAREEQREQEIAKPGTTGYSPALTPDEITFNKQISEHMDKITERREKIAEKVDGENGSVATFTAFKENIIDTCFASIINKLPVKVEEFAKMSQEVYEKLLRDSEADFRVKINRL